MAYKWTVSVTITKDDATGLSDAKDFGGGATRMGIIMPAAWDAANLSFQVCDTAGGTFADLYTEAGAEAAPASTPAQGKAYSLATLQPTLAPWRWVKVRSGLTGAAVTQTSATPATITFVFQR
jgi:hypothetical protein